MKKVLLSFILLGSLFFGSPLNAAGLHWEQDLQAAFDKASATKQPLMVMVESTHCRWCKKMIHQTLENDGISQRLNNFVLVKVDKEGDEARFELPEVKYVPTIFFMTPKKKIVQRVTGYFNVQDFNSWIDDAEKALKKR
ncbi:MAG TPA: thioredoxin family protein [Epsilonproteobacteria bacterium]|nr:thioredoxin family protein [Campylobacterota bacterium]